MATKPRFKPGDRVIVPRHTVPGTVLEVRGPPDGRHVLVRVVIPGSRGETLDETEVSYPEKWLQPAA